MYCNERQRDVPGTYHDFDITYNYRYLRILDRKEALRLMKVQRKLAEQIRVEGRKPRFLIRILRWLRIIRPRYTQQRIADIGCALQWSANDFLTLNRLIRLKEIPGEKD